MSARTKPATSAAPPEPATHSQGFEAEPTAIGTQSLVPGVRPITQRDRLDMLAAAPMLPRRPQRPADSGLFDMNARLQIEMFQPIPRASG